MCSPAHSSQWMHQALAPSAPTLSHAPRQGATEGAPAGLNTSSPAASLGPVSPRRRASSQPVLGILRRRLACRLPRPLRRLRIQQSVHSRLYKGYEQSTRPLSSWSLRHGGAACLLRDHTADCRLPYIMRLLACACARSRRQ